MIEGSKEKFQELLQQLRSGKYYIGAISIVACGLNDEDLSELIAAIIKNPKQNARIKTLDLSHNYFLKHTRICGLTGLTFLKITNSHVEALSIDNCPNLLQLSAQRNRLRYVSFGNVTTLLDVDLHINRLTEICLDKQPELLRVNLSDNEIRELDLSGLTKVVSLQIVNQIPQGRIISLYLGSNPLTERFYFDATDMNASSRLQVTMCWLNKPQDAQYEAYSDGHERFDAVILTSDAQLEELLDEYTQMFGKYKLKNCILRSAKIMAYLHTGAQSSLPRAMASRIAILDFLDTIYAEYHRMFKQLMPKAVVRAATASPTEYQLELEGRVQIKRDLIDNFMRGSLIAEMNRMCEIVRYSICPASTRPQTKQVVNWDLCLQRLTKANAYSRRRQQRAAATMVLCRSIATPFIWMASTSAQRTLAALTPTKDRKKVDLSRQTPKNTP